MTKENQRIARHLEAMRLPRSVFGSDRGRMLSWGESGANWLAYNSSKPLLKNHLRDPLNKA
jgi:hypothetical protein